MATAADRIILQAKHLSLRDRRKVVSALEASLLSAPSRGAGPKRERGYKALLALAGTASADAEDVSANKYAHLATAYTDDE